MFITYQESLLSKIRNKFPRIFEEVDLEVSIPDDPSSDGIYITNNTGAIVQDNGNDLIKPDNSRTLDQLINVSVDNSSNIISQALSNIRTTVGELVTNFESRNIRQGNQNTRINTREATVNSIKFMKYLELVNNLLNLEQLGNNNNFQREVGDNYMNNIINRPLGANLLYTNQNNQAFLDNYGMRKEGQIFDILNNNLYNNPNFNVNTDYNIPTVTINFTQPVNLTFNKTINNNELEGPIGLAVVAPVLDSEIVNAVNAVGALVNASKCNNITRIVLTYNKLSQVHVDLFVQGQANNNPFNNNNRGIFQDDLIITDAQLNIPAPGVAPGVAPAALPAAFLNNCRLSFPDIIIPQGDYQEHIYTPINILYNQIMTNYLNEINNFIRPIEVNIGNLNQAPKNFTVLDQIYNNLIQLIERINRFQIRYNQFLMKYKSNVLDQKIQNGIDNIPNYLSNLNFSNTQIGRTLNRDIIQKLEFVKYIYQEDNIKQSLEILETNINEILKSFNTINQCNLINSYWNSQDNDVALNKYLNDDLTDLDFYINEQEEDYFQAGAPLTNFNNNYVRNIGVNDNNSIPAGLTNPGVNPIPGPADNKFIRFANNGGGNEFIDPELVISNISGYFYYARHRLIQEIILYIFNNPVNDANNLLTLYNPDNNIPDYVKEIDDLIKSQQGDISLHRRIPLNLAAIGDIIDKFLIKDFENKINELILRKFNENLRGNNYTLLDDTEADRLPVELENTINTLELDDEFSLNLSKIDKQVREVIENIANIDENEVLSLGKGDLLIDFIKSRIIQTVNKDEIDQEKDRDKESKNGIKEKMLIKHYPESYLSNQLDDEIKCITFHGGIYDKILKGNNSNKLDHYGNSPLMYALKSKNLLAINELLNRKVNVLFKNKNNENSVTILLDQLKNMNNIFGNSVINKLANDFSQRLNNNILKTANVENIMKNYDKISLLFLYLQSSARLDFFYGKNYPEFERLRQIVLSCEIFKDQVVAIEKDKCKRLGRNYEYNIDKCADINHPCFNQNNNNCYRNNGNVPLQLVGPLGNATMLANARDQFFVNRQVELSNKIIKNPLVDYLEKTTAQSIPKYNMIKLSSDGSVLENDRNIFKKN